MSGFQSLYVFEKNKTDLKLSFAQPVIYTKRGCSISGLGPKNVFGAVVCPGHPVMGLL